MIEIRCDSLYCHQKFEPHSDWRQIQVTSKQTENCFEITAYASVIENFATLASVDLAAKIGCQLHWRELVREAISRIHAFPYEIKEEVALAMPEPVASPMPEEKNYEPSEGKSPEF